MHNTDELAVAVCEQTGGHDVRLTKTMLDGAYYICTRCGASDVLSLGHEKEVEMYLKLGNAYNATHRP